MVRPIQVILLVCLLTGFGAFIGCGGGGGSGSGSGTSESESASLVGVMDDVNGDSNLDMLQVSTETDPITITQLLVGDGAGKFVDDTANLTDNTLSQEMSDAILARIRSGAPIPEGIEVLYVREGSVTKTIYLIFS